MGMKFSPVGIPIEIEIEFPRQPCWRQLNQNGADRARVGWRCREEILNRLGEIKIFEHLDYKKKGEPVMKYCNHSHAPSSEVGTFCPPGSLNPSSNKEYLHL